MVRDTGARKLVADVGYNIEPQITWPGISSHYDIGNLGLTFRLIMDGTA